MELSDRGHRQVVVDATGQTRAAVREDPRALSSGTDFRPAEVRASAWAVNVQDQKRQLLARPEAAQLGRDRRGARLGSE